MLLEVSPSTLYYKLYKNKYMYTSHIHVDAVKIVVIQGWS